MLDMRAQKFGIELEFTGMTREHAANTINTVLNGEVRYVGEGYDTWQVRTADGRKWKVMSDASVRDDHGHTRSKRSCEFVTPICTIEDVPIYQECIRALRKEGAKVNSSCGLHIHVDGSNHDARSLKNLAFLFKSKQDLIFKAVHAEDRKGNVYCREIGDKLISDIRAKVKKDTTLDEFGNVFYASHGYSSRERRTHYSNTRYYALNYHSVWYHGTVEFRLFHSTLHAGKIKAWLMLCLGMSAYAINKESTRVMSKAIPAEEEKYTMRTFLWQMGFTGDEFKNVRAHLLNNLEGLEYHESKRGRRRTANSPAA
jgi:hypothetical protein